MQGERKSAALLYVSSGKEKTYPERTIEHRGHTTGSKGVDGRRMQILAQKINKSSEEKMG